MQKYVVVFVPKHVVAMETTAILNMHICFSKLNSYFIYGQISTKFGVLVQEHSINTFY